MPAPLQAVNVTLCLVAVILLLLNATYRAGVAAPQAANCAAAVEQHAEPHRTESGLVTSIGTSAPAMHVIDPRAAKQSATTLNETAVVVVPSHARCIEAVQR